MLSERSGEQQNQERRTENRDVLRNPWFSVLRSWFSILASWLWSSGAPLALALIALLFCLLAYQPRFALSDRLTRSPTNIRINGAYPIEGVGATAQRWTSPHATVRFSGIGAGDYSLLLRFHGGGQAGAGRALRIGVGSEKSQQGGQQEGGQQAGGQQSGQQEGGQQSSQQEGGQQSSQQEGGQQSSQQEGGHGGLAVRVREDWQEVWLAIPASAVDSANGDLVVSLDVPPMVGLPGDPRRLGVALQSVEVQPVADGRGFIARVPTGRVAQLALILLLVFWSARSVGLGVRDAFGAGLGLGLMLAIGLAIARMDTAQLLDLGMLVLPWTLLLGLAVRIYDVRCTIYDFCLGKHLQNDLRTASIVNRKSAIVNVSVVNRKSAIVNISVLLIFTLRLGGLLHPQYINIDQGLRANQLVNIAAGRVDVVRPQLEQQYEWGTREPVPYSLLTYYLLVPLTWFWHDDALITAMEATSVLLDATVPLLLWALLRHKTPRRASPLWQPAAELEAAFAGLCYAALPVGYLFFHDGSFPTTIGIWFVLVALVSIRAFIERQNAQGRLLPSAFCLLPSAFLALALVAYVTHIAFVGFLVAALIGSLWLLGGQRRSAIQLTLVLVLALAIDWLLYYRDYTVTLLERTIPAFASQIIERGSVGHDTGLLYNTAVNSFGQHLVAHFRTWPVLLAAVALLILLLRRRNRFVTHLGLAYGLFFVATTVAERWFGLWNKHMAFVAPGVALLAGVALAWLWRRGRAGQVLCVTLLAFLFWSSTLAWGNRALWYVLPASAL